MKYALFAAVAYLLGLGYACAIDQSRTYALGWSDADKPRQLLLPFLYIILGVVGLWFLLAKLVPDVTPDWALYLWVMVLRRPYRVKTDLGAKYIFQLYQRPRRKAWWRRDLAARIIRLNRPAWARQRAADALEYADADLFTL